MSGLIGSTNVTEVGRDGDCRAGKEIRLDRGEASSLGSCGSVVIFRAALRAAGETGNSLPFFTCDTGAGFGGGMEGVDEVSEVSAVCEWDRVGVGLVMMEAGAVGVSARDTIDDDLNTLRALGGDKSSGRWGGGGLSHRRMVK